jgi:acetyltransferase-like isoleucine patch superfamily enzyme
VSDDAAALRAQLHGMNADLALQMRDRWQRDLPFNELVVDRWERARRLGFGEGTCVYDSTFVAFDVTVGADTWIGPFCVLDGSGGLRIGAHCAISSGVHITTHDAVKRTLSGNTQPLEVAPVEIGDCCYVGSQAMVLKGVTIGHHSVVGAYSLVTRDLPPYSVAYGVPARVRGRVVIAADGTIDIVPVDGAAAAA